MSEKDFYVKLNGREFNINNLPDNISLNKFDDRTKEILSIFDTDSKKGELSKAELQEALTFFANKEKEIGHHDEYIHGKDWELMANDLMKGYGDSAKRYLYNAVYSLFGAIEDGYYLNIVNNIEVDKDNPKEQFEKVAKDIKSRNAFDALVKKFGYGIVEYDEKAIELRNRAVREEYLDVVSNPVVIKIENKLYDVDLEKGVMSEHKIDLSKLEKNPDGTYKRVIESGFHDTRFHDGSASTPGAAAYYYETGRRSVVTRVQVIDKNGNIVTDKDKAAKSLGIKRSSYEYEEYWDDKTKSFVYTHDRNKHNLTWRMSKVADCEAMMRAEIEMQKENIQKSYEEFQEQMNESMIWKPQKPEEE